jgi:hypothetical protein
MDYHFVPNKRYKTAVEGKRNSAISLKNPTHFLSICIAYTICVIFVVSIFISVLFIKFDKGCPSHDENFYTCDCAYNNSAKHDKRSFKMFVEMVVPINDNSTPNPLVRYPATGGIPHFIVDKMQGFALCCHPKNMPTKRFCSNTSKFMIVVLKEDHLWIQIQSEKLAKQLKIPLKTTFGTLECIITWFVSME